MSKVEKRKNFRQSVMGPMTYRYVTEDLLHEGICLDISGSGILFQCGERISFGKALLINIAPENPIMPTLSAFVEVVRNEEAEARQIHVACLIKGIRGV